MPRMSIRSARWPSGVPCWADVMAPDVEAAGRFYAAVLGWTVPQPDQQWGGYVVANVDGAAAAGIGPMQAGAPPAWTLYFATDDADGHTATTRAAGGKVLADPMDVADLGRMAILSDPTGAVFGLWQAGTMIGAELVNEPGGLVWEDLRSSEPAKAQEFYRELFGFRLDPMEMAGPDYSTFALPGEEAPLGGMGGMMGMPEGTPSHWLVYFAVTDTDTAVAAAEASGGTVVAPAIDTEYGRMAGLADPYGAVFMVMGTTGEGTPDRAE